MAMKMMGMAIGLLMSASLAAGQATPAQAAKANAKAKVHKAAHHARAVKPAPAPAAAAAAPTAPAATAPAAGTDQTSAQVENTSATAPAHRRDPFVNPVQAFKEGRNAACSGGKRCLAVNEMVLRGVVKSVNGMIAVVENAAQRTYFLHENDPIYNGYVKKITPDSVVLREHYTDNLGHDSERDVVKSVSAPAV